MMRFNTTIVVAMFCDVSYSLHRGVKMARIAFIAADKALFLQGKKIVHELGLENEVAFYLARLKRAKILGARLQNEVDVIVSRGGTAKVIIDSGVKIPVVEIAITGQDLAQLFQVAKETTGLSKPTVAMLGFSNMVMGIETISSILGIELIIYPLETMEDIPLKMAEVMSSKVDVVAGGKATVNLALSMGLKAIPMRSGGFSIRTAFIEAQKIALGRTIEKERAQEFKVLVDHSLEGIININSQKMIRVINQTALKLLKCSFQDCQGKNIDTLLKLPNLDECLTNGQITSGQIIQFGDLWMMLNIAPIIVNDAITGAMINFQDVTRIQEMESKIRHEIIAKRFTAKYQLNDIIGISKEILETKRIAEEIAPVDATVLIRGESGAGKELFAQSIHLKSKRKNGPFVAVNCAALPPNLLESELFGYVEGAFTGAIKKGKAGLFEMAHHGTIFLDEISEMEKYGQSRLLRVLQEKQVMRLGDDKYIPVDIRVIAASNKNLVELMNQGLFREDLYYRLKVLTLNLPPLRKRKGDVEFLCQYFLGCYKSLYKKHLDFSPEAYDRLTEYNWPGNVRELMHFIERTVLVTKGNLMDEVTVVKYLEDREYETTPQVEEMELTSPDEKENIRMALAQVNSNISRAAKLLGIDRSTLYRKLKEYKIELKKYY